MEICIFQFVIRLGFYLQGFALMGVFLVAVSVKNCMVTFKNGLTQSKLKKFR